MCARLIDGFSSTLYQSGLTVLIEKRGPFSKPVNSTTIVKDSIKCFKDVWVSKNVPIFTFIFYFVLIVLYSPNNLIFSLL